MTDHKAKPEQWAAMERWASQNDNACSCIVELRDRINALTLTLKDEAECNNVCIDNVAERLRKLESMTRQDEPLMSRMTRAVAPYARPYRFSCYKVEARNAIREIIDWIKPMRADATAAEIIEALRQELNDD